MRADLVSSTTLTSGTSVDLETSLNASSGGDLLWTGSSLVPQGNATVARVGLVGASVYDGFNLNSVQGYAGTYSNAALTSNLLPVGEVVFVKDNAGHYAKMRVTATGSSLSFDFTTFGAAAGPAITKILNNYSFMPQGVPNYGIAPGSLFVVIGTALNSQPLSALQSSVGGLPVTFHGTSITVTVNGTVVHPGLYYTSPTAVAGVLPSNTPAGTGTLTLTNGFLSDSQPIQVVQSALGLDTFTGSGGGMAVMQDANFNLLTAANPAKPGQIVIFWGSGVGPDPSNDDRTFPLKQNNLTNLPFDFYIGGKKADVAYRGRSQFPGVDQIVVTIPPDTAVGCAVSAWVTTGAVSSNSVSIPLSSDGAPCVDPILSSFPSSGQVNLGTLVAEQSFHANGTSETALVAGFAKWNVKSFLSDPTRVSLGGCIVYPFSSIIGPGASIDAGDISAQVPNGAMLAVPQFQVGGYELDPLPDGDFRPSGTYTFTGSGSKVNGGVGAFQASIDYPAEITWAQMNTLTTITRSQGLTISWQGGDSNTFILISGGAAPSNGNIGAAVFFACTAKTGDGHFDIPSAVLNSLPAGTANIGVKQDSFPKQFSVSGLDYAFIGTTTAFATGNLVVK
jgi:uncharacterized protein (TIGR03437 family)